jgi:nitrate reductase (cytochrome), electron transfer subunit
MSADHQFSLAKLVGFIVISVAVVGFFTGLQAPMNPVFSEDATNAKSTGLQHTPPEEIAPPGDVILATRYADMPEATHERKKLWQSQLVNLKSSIDPLAEVIIEPGEKQAALERRERNRAFNGAPPTIPHPVDQRSVKACLACHGEGALTISLRIPRMSHQLLANCTQCHVEGNPQHMAAELFRENTFAGLAAPTGGPRAFEGAPPMIPHSTWMRKDCLSCHGHTGLQGIRTTHPWRRNCQQCHAPSSTMNQTLLAAEPDFLPPPNVAN